MECGENVVRHISSTFGAAPKLGPSASVFKCANDPAPECFLVDFACVVSNDNASVVVTLKVGAIFVYLSHYPTLPVDWLMHCECGFQV